MYWNAHHQDSWKKLDFPSFQYLSLLDFKLAGEHMDLCAIISERAALITKMEFVWKSSALLQDLKLISRRIVG